MTKFNSTLSRTLTSQQLRKVFSFLEDETTPYEARTTIIKNGKCLLSLWIHKENKQYFQQLIERAKNEAKV